MDSRRYVAGIDVGTHSIGFAAIELDEKDMPAGILSLVSHIHDSGLDPDQQKSATTRLASSGVARRTRRLYRRRKKRIVRLEKFLVEQDWKTLPNESYEDPYLPWKARVRLATERTENEAEQGEMLSLAIRHIAHHRGWRNPYKKVRSLYAPGEPSDAFVEIKKGIEESKKIKIPDEATVAQVVMCANLGVDRLRGGGKGKDKKKPQDEINHALISARLQQVDHAREINKICEKQGIDDSLRKKIIDLVFDAESPKGAQVGRVGKDPLQPSLDRALKASDAFQRYRIAALIGNLRIRDGENSFELTNNQRKLVFDHLVNLPAKVEPTWLAIAELLGIDRGQLQGTAKMTDDGERAGARPPVHDTNRVIESAKPKSLGKWWKEVSDADRAAMLKALSNADSLDLDTEEGASVRAYFASISDDEHEKLDLLHLPIGRAAYSEDTLRRLTERMISDGVDLYTARKNEFGIPKDWAPPSPRIGEPVGNPAVDRVLKEVARWIEAATDEWGAPERIVIEHVRDGFISESKARKIDRDNNRRAQKNRELFAELSDKFGNDVKHSRAALWRYQSVQRQNGQCAYCGSPITFHNSEMDHIVPRKGEGSTNRRENLVAVCHRCNHSKSNAVFSVWAEQSAIPGVSVKEAVERTKHWNEDRGMKKAEFNKFRSEVVSRFKRTTVDDPIDARSMESVAWMANELRGRIAQRFSDEETKVNVYRGSLTASARRAAGISGKLQFIDGPGKSRLDRRHHAVDAAVICLTTPFVAEALATRNNLRESAEYTNGTNQWKEYSGGTASHRTSWNRWKKQMSILAPMLQKALSEDRIAVKRNLRLRVGNGRVHEDTIGELARVKVGSALPTETIDRAATEALWCALTRHPDFNWKDGLPEDPDRTIRVNGSHLNADDEIEVFPVNAGAIKVRGGYAELSRFHHARIYRIDGGKKPVYAMLRVYNVDLAKHRTKDVFSVELPPQTISMRQAEAKLRKALREGTATYLGWVVVDDELLINPASFNTGQIGTFQQEIGLTRRWSLDGFYSDSKFRLRPVQVSAEGLNKDSNEDVRKIVDSPGWRPAVNALLAQGDVAVIRRDALGRPRLESAAHLPVSWKVR